MLELFISVHSEVLKVHKVLPVKEVLRVNKVRLV
jgi:hypothetical protein